MVFMVWAGILWLLENLPAWVIVLFIIWNVLMQFRWCWYEMGFRPSDPYQWQLASASHGAAFIILAPFLAIAAEHLWLPRELVPWIWPAAFVVMAYGAYLLMLGYSRTQNYLLNAQLLTTATIRIAAGVGVLFVHQHHLLPIFGWTARALFFIGAWLVITGITKAALIWRPWERKWVSTPVNPQPYGNSGFADDDSGPISRADPYGNASFAGGAPSGAPKQKRFMAGWHWG